MNSEKRQLQAILGIVVLIGICICSFLAIGGEFKFLFINFSADGVLTQSLWLLPILLLLAQQAYIIPEFMKGYWALFSTTPPTSQEVYLPVLNEDVLYSKPIIVKGLWGAIVGLALLCYLPILPYIVSSGSAITTITFALVLVAIACYLGLTIIRGFGYLKLRKEIYALHTKYFGSRGESPYFWLFKILYFVPLARVLSISFDIQVLDKLTKFNDLDNMTTELMEEQA